MPYVASCNGTYLGERVALHATWPSRRSGATADHADNRGAGVKNFVL